jgi:hypothetical protein
MLKIPPFATFCPNLAAFLNAFVYKGSNPNSGLVKRIKIIGARNKYK